MSFNKKISFQIDAQDNASKTISNVKTQFTKLGENTSKVSSTVSSFGSKASSAISGIGQAVKTTTVAVVGLGSAMGMVVKKTVGDSMKLENALMGLTTVARAFNVSQEDAKKAAIALAEDGLMTVSEAANGLKNLLASKFNLPEAIKLMEGFKDSASFNRQAALGFGEAIVGATEGIKNQNSILVDNAGITKNLSMILKDAGYSQMDLMNVTSDAGVRQALYNGLLKETSIFQGDAERSSSTLTGQIASLSTSWFNLSASIGQALSPVVTVLIEAISVEVNKLREYIKNNEASVKEWGATASQKVSEVINWFRTHREELKTTWEVFKTLGTVFVFVITSIITAITILKKSMDAYFYAGFVLLDKQISLWEGFKKTALGAVNAVIDRWKQLVELLSKPVKAVIRVFKKEEDDDKDGERATGGPVISGGNYLVGEKGPEMFVPNSSGTIIPNSKMGSTFNFTFNGDISDKNQLINEIKNVINREMELSQRGIA